MSKPTTNLAPPPREPASEPAQPAAPAPPPASHEEVDLAHTVDKLLAEIDTSTAELADQIEAEAEAAETTQSAAPAAPTQVAAVAQSAAPTSPAAPAELLAQVDQLMADVAAAPNATPGNATPLVDAAASPDESLDLSESLDAAPVFVEAAPTPPPAPAAKPVADPAGSTGPVLHSTTIASLDDEVSKLADSLLENNRDVSPLAPAPAAAAASAPKRDVAPQPVEEEPDRPAFSLRAAMGRAGAMVSPLLVKVLAPLSAPLAKQSPAVRQSVGWIAVSSLFFAAILWGVVLTRKPAELLQDEGSYDFAHGAAPALHQPDAHGAKGDAKADGHGDGHGDAHGKADGHGKADAHGKTDSKKKAAKKPPRTNKAAAKAKKDAAAKKDAGHGGH